MIRISTTQLWVHDQEEALAFWTEKVGMEVRADVTLPELGDFRWLSVGPPGQEDIAIVLMAIPGPPVMDGETKKQVEELMSKGFAGTVFLATDDIRASYEELKGRGVEFTEEPSERPYGIDSAFRDPSGNGCLEEVRMPQKAWNSKRERQYRHIKDSLEERGKSEDTAEEIAARTVNKERARAGEAKTTSRSSMDDISPGRRGGLRSHRGEGGRTYRQLYNEARERGIDGRSRMTKAQLEKAVGGG